MNYYFSLSEYEVAIARLQMAKEQIIPNGRPCAVCGSDQHFAFHCPDNPLLLAHSYVAIQKHLEEIASIAERIRNEKD